MVEIILTVTLLAIVLGLGVTGVTRLQRSLAPVVMSDVKQVVRTAARQARAGQEDAAWGVYFGYDEGTRRATELVLFAGASYAARDVSQDVTLPMSDDVLFLSVSLAGGGQSGGNDHEVVFAPFSGTTAQYGTLTLESYGRQEILNISQAGFAVEQ